VPRRFIRPLDSAKLDGIDPDAYLRYLLTRLTVPETIKLPNCTECFGTHSVGAISISPLEHEPRHPRFAAYLQFNKPARDTLRNSTG
jgi:hypothetical protein